MLQVNNGRFLSKCLEAGFSGTHPFGNNAFLKMFVRNCVYTPSSQVNIGI